MRWRRGRNGGAAGPHVIVTALRHGHELCGAITLDIPLRRDLRPTRGKLTLGFANIAAYLALRSKPANRVALHRPPWRA